MISDFYTKEWQYLVFCEDEPYLLDKLEGGTVSDGKTI